jgi:nucleoid DNA-binding protein
MPLRWEPGSSKSALSKAAYREIRNMHSFRKLVSEGRNPATGEDMMLRPRKVVTFKWSGKVREKMDGN